MAGAKIEASKTPQAIRVLLVDDHPLVRQGLKDVMEARPGFDVCGEGEDIPTALKAFVQTKPDIVIVDLKLGDDSGLDLIRQLRARSRSVRILVCSMYEESAFAERALRAGAEGYVNKHDPSATILEAVSAVMAGKLYVSGDFKDEVLRRFTSNLEEKNSDPLQCLSDREMQVFEMIGGGMGIHEIAEHLHLSSRTIETYRDGIKNKLNLGSSREVVRYSAQWMLEQG